MICEIDFPDIDGGRWRMRFVQPHRLFITHVLDEVPTVIAQAEAAARDEHWVVGFVAYEAAPAFDPALQVKAATAALPLAAFAVYGSYDEALTTDAKDRDSFACGRWSMTASRSAIDAGIADIRAAIGNGDYYQVNYTTRLESKFSGSAAALYAALCEAQPDGYGAYLDGGEWQIASASPELFFDWTPDRTLTTRPMKGTAPRTASVDALRDSAKERAENLMIVDLLRNDLARVAETGSVAVTRLFDIEPLPTAWQMTSTVRCKTRTEVTLVDVFRALFPCGSVTGAPKVAAMQAIAELESTPRGVYCGAIGLIRPNGHATFNVAIRTVAVDAKTGTARCGIGSGITLDSTAAAEYAEWLVKRRFLLHATAAFDLIETLRLEAGHYWLLDRHLRRLQDSAEHFGFDCDVDGIRRKLEGNVRQHSKSAWRVRLLLGRDGSVKLETHALEASPAIVRVALALTPIDSGSETLQHKTSERAIYAPHAPASADIFDTLLFNERGEVTEFTRGNVVVELDGKRITPPLSCGLLPGVLRAELLASGEVSEAIVMRADLARATRLWFINSVRGELLAQIVGPVIP
ncbi:Para-aminobenzoate synthase, aminase component [Georgfuchsia toluolica]|uniref:Para-aminobenzoate synthase, aminase component n=1 Tax=Georgfuchsia toluolica TaxID=424218 RepID=A0A916J4R3_9PROT|nr:aminodeoxychorismate synthase component I [Georgfuchsia toluolica]CAG4884204.1 Para-aminobenzoate synthase, aminase component [Georgfuchsia toluolica]